MHDPTPTTAPAASPLDRLFAVLDEQRRTVERLGGLADRQGLLVEQGRTEPLVALLVERGRLVERFVEMQEHVRELAAGIGGADGRPPAADASERREIDRRVRELEEGVARVLERDAVDQARLEERRDDAKRRLGSIDHGRTALAAYGGGPGARPGPRLADRRG